MELGIRLLGFDLITQFALTLLSIMFDQIYAWNMLYSLKYNDNNNNNKKESNTLVITKGNFSFNFYTTLGQLPRESCL